MYDITSKKSMFDNKTNVLLKITKGKNKKKYTNITNAGWPQQFSQLYQRYSNEKIPALS